MNLSASGSGNIPSMHLGEAEISWCHGGTLQFASNTPE